MQLVVATWGMRRRMREVLGEFVPAAWCGGAMVAVLFPPLALLGDAPAALCLAGLVVVGAAVFVGVLRLVSRQTLVRVVSMRRSAQGRDALELR